MISLPLLMIIGDEHDDDTGEIPTPALDGSGRGINLSIYLLHICTSSQPTPANSPTIESNSYDYKTGALSPDIVAQTEQCLRNAGSALREAGATIEDVVRVRYIVPEREAFPRVWPVLKKWFGNARPAATMIAAGLMREEMKIEVEVTAVKGSAAAAPLGRDGGEAR